MCKQFIKNLTNKEKILVLLIPSFYLFLAALRTTIMSPEHYEYQFFWDHHKYIYMAENPFQYHLAPYCWRILNPLIVYLLPFGTTNDFFILTSLTLFFSSLMVYYLLRILKFETEYAITGLIIFLGMGWIIKYNIYDFWLTDSLLNVFILLLYLSLIRKKDVALSLLLATGVLVKETVLFIAPLYYTFNTEKLVSPKLILKNVFLVLPALSVFLVVRLAIPGLNGNPAYIGSLPPELQNITYNTNSYDIVEFVLSFHIQYPLYKMVAIVISAYGIIPLLFSVLGIKKNIKIFYIYFPIIIISLLQLFYAVNLPRLLAISFWPILLMGVNGIKYISTKYNISVYWFIFTAVTIPIINLLSKYTIMIQGRIQLFIIVSAMLLFTFHKLYKRVSIESNISRQV
ncbi:MAG: hypothetical protein CVV24_04795 [Ignavibacteriae bacterium HGW-Ignavibacteriae-3]|nr:MAG: hypothetical protein CVV24_04795 [Ignavibacteriae bacterium HGW-Ignavibacteriae-3]